MWRNGQHRSKRCHVENRGASISCIVMIATAGPPRACSEYPKQHRFNGIFCKMWAKISLTHIHHIERTRNHRDVNSNDHTVKITNCDRNDNRIGGNDARSSTWCFPNRSWFTTCFGDRTRIETGITTSKNVKQKMIAAASTNTIANPKRGIHQSRPQVHQSSGEAVHGFGVPLGISHCLCLDQGLQIFKKNVHCH